MRPNVNIEYTLHYKCLDWQISELTKQRALRWFFCLSKWHFKSSGIIKFTEKCFKFFLSLISDLGLATKILLWRVLFLFFLHKLFLFYAQITAVIFQIARGDLYTPNTEPRDRLINESVLTLIFSISNNFFLLSFSDLVHSRRVSICYLCLVQCQIVCSWRCHCKIIIFGAIYTWINIINGYE